MSSLPPLRRVRVGFTSGRGISAAALQSAQTGRRNLHALQLSGGRFEIGVGRGISPFELAHFNVNFLEARDMFEESLKVVVAGLREHKLAHRGPHYRFAGAAARNPPQAGTESAVLVWHLDARGARVRRSSWNEYCGRRTERRGQRGAAGISRAACEVSSGARQSQPAGCRADYRRVASLLCGRHRYRSADTARPAYKVFYANITKLWRDHGTIPAMFTDDLDRARNGDAAIVGSPASVRDSIARYFEQTGCSYLVLSFAWGSLSYEQSRRSLDLFVTKVMPEFVGRV